MNLKKYEEHTIEGSHYNHRLMNDADIQLIADAPLLLQALIDERAEVKRLRLLFRELINDMSADDYIEWCNRIGCPDGLEVEVLKED